jgi:hypothetical protein
VGARVPSCGACRESSACWAPRSTRRPWRRVSRCPQRSADSVPCSLHSRSVNAQTSHLGRGAEHRIGWAADVPARELEATARKRAVAERSRTVTPASRKSVTSKPARRSVDEGRRDFYLPVSGYARKASFGARGPASNPPLTAPARRRSLQSAARSHVGNNPGAGSSVKFREGPRATPLGSEKRRSTCSGFERR